MLFAAEDPDVLRAVLAEGRCELVRNRVIEDEPQVAFEWILARRE